MPSPTGPSLAERLVQLSSGLAVVAVVVAAGLLLFPRPLADVFFAGWVLGAVALTAFGAAAAWTNRTPAAWVAALLLSALAVVGLWSIGSFIAPAALLLLAAAGLSQWAVPRGPSQVDHENPPTVLEAVSKTLSGAVLVVVGAGLFYVGALVWEWFSRGCGNETLDCALAVTQWGAVGLTFLGLVAVAGGAWRLWEQVTVGRAHASHRRG